jgi:predicted nucleotidyltransferase
MKFSTSFTKKESDFMKISALIAEFNPFHTGHKLLIDSMRSESDGVISIMSGNFVQRGECAVFDKMNRSECAVENGVDLVLELPAVYALSSAEGFAKGAVQTLEACGVVSQLHFGSECGNLSDLSLLAELLNEESPSFSDILSENLSKGMSFPLARQSALSHLTDKASLLESPNNILAVEYIRELKKLSSKIKPVTIKRVGNDYNDTAVNGPVASASAIRAMLKNGADVSEYMLCRPSSPIFMDAFDTMICARLKTISKEELCSLPDCNEELASRLMSSSRYNTFGEVVSSVSCRSYTQSRIRRILCNMLIGNTFSALPSPEYIRPLAFNKKGSEILRKMKSTASLQIAARGALLKDNVIFGLECRATDIYNLARGIEGGREFESVYVG